jgi:hypothetical protein
LSGVGLLIRHRSSYFITFPFTNFDIAMLLIYKMASQRAIIFIPGGGFRAQEIIAIVDRVLRLLDRVFFISLS